MDGGAWHQTCINKGRANAAQTERAGHDKEQRTMGRTKKTDEGTEQTTMAISEGTVARCTRLAESATVKQTPEQVFETALRIGLKMLEKRRTKTTDARVEKAEALLRAMGKIA